MRTSYKKNRPFDFKLIDHVEPNVVLYRRQMGLSNYDVMKMKSDIWAKIADIMDCDVDFCLMRWNNLHYQYRKESRRPGGSTWPYFERLGFLANAQIRTRAKPNKAPKAQQSSEIVELPAGSSLVKQGTWQTYDDCVVMHVVTEMDQQHVDGTLIIEEIIEQNEQMLHEEIIYEQDDQLDGEEHMSRTESTETTMEDEATSTVETLIDELIALPGNDYIKMDHILQQMEGSQKILAERRIMAFVLKCQLRALMDEPIDDIIV